MFALLFALLLQYVVTGLCMIGGLTGTHTSIMWFCFDIDDGSGTFFTPSLLFSVFSV